MIKFFRRFRYEIMEKNKTGKPSNQTAKYLKYAIGEIALVVIGIFIALQLNNWNENRKVKNIEQALLKDLKVEINTSISELQEIIESHTNNLNATIQFRTLIFEGKKASDIDNSDWWKLYSEMDYNMTFDPKLGILKSIISSGKIDYISNKELRYQLSSLTDLISDTNESTNEITINRPLLLHTRSNKFFERKSDNSLKYNFEKLIGDSGFIWWLGWLKALREEGLEEERELLIILEDMIKTIDSEIK